MVGSVNYHSREEYDALKQKYIHENNSSKDQRHFDLSRSPCSMKNSGLEGWNVADKKYSGPFLELGEVLHNVELFNKYYGSLNVIS